MIFGFETWAALGALAACGACWLFCIRRANQAATNWRHLAEGVEQGLSVVQDGKVVFANPAWRELLRLETTFPLEGAAPLEGSTCAKCRAAGAAMAALPADEAEGYVFRCKNCVTTRLLGVLEYRARAANWNGRRALQISVQDISRPVEGEEGLAHGEALLQMVIDAIPHRVYVKTLEGRFLFVNKAKAAFYRKSVPEMIGKTLHEVKGDGQTNGGAGRARDAEVVARGKTVEFPQVTIPYPDGRVSLVHVSKAPIHDCGGRICGIVGVSEDITERTRAEEQLRENQRLLRAVVDSAPFSISVKNREGRYIIANEAVGRIYGVSPDEVVGKRLGELPLQPPEMVKRARETDRQVFETAESVRFDEDPVVTADGTRLIRNLVKLPLFDDEHRVNGVLAIGEDITERTRVESALKAERRLLKAIFDALPLRVYVKDLNHRYVIVNHAFSAFHGLPPEEIVGNTVEDLPNFTPQHRAGTRKRVSEVLATGTVLKTPEIWATRPDGNQDVFRSTTVPLLDENQAIVGVLGIAEDITEMVQARDRLRSQGELLKSVMDAYVRQSERSLPDG